MNLAGDIGRTGRVFGHHARTFPLSARLRLRHRLLADEAEIASCKRHRVRVRRQTDHLVEPLGCGLEVVGTLGAATPDGTQRDSMCARWRPCMHFHALSGWQRPGRSREKPRQERGHALRSHRRNVPLPPLDRCQNHNVSAAKALCLVSDRPALRAVYSARFGKRSNPPRPIP
jgi:hypothetical protein